MAVRRWLYNRVAGVFRKGNRAATGIELRDALASRSAASAADLASRLASGNLSLASWSAEMGARVRAATIGQFALGIGGTANLTPLMRSHLSAMVGEQLGYLRGFARDIAAASRAGVPLTVEQIASRADLYFDTAVGAYEQGRAMSQGVAFPQYPPAHARCRCWIDYATVGRDRVASWVTSADERVCPICTGLASQYTNIVIGAA